MKDETIQGIVRLTLYRFKRTYISMKKNNKIMLKKHKPRETIWRSWRVNWKDILCLLAYVYRKVNSVVVCWFVCLFVFESFDFLTLRLVMH